MTNNQNGVIRFYILLAFGFVLLFSGAYIFGKLYMRGQEAANTVSLKEVPEEPTTEESSMEAAMEETTSSTEPAMEIGMPEGIGETEPGAEVMVETDHLIFEAIKEAFAEKYDRPLDQINLTVDELTSDYAKGGVHFVGETGGGWFLAAYVDDAWVIVDDGNGTVSCQKIEEYDFPTSMVPECYDEIEAVSVTR
jgi:hypothetical protein